MIGEKDLLDALPVAVYTTDAEGRITFYNEAAAKLWGRRPEIGVDTWCGSWRLFWPDGRPLPHDECPMAIALREGRPVRGIDAVAQRPDGTTFAFLPYPSPIRDASGRITGAINVLIDITRRKKREMESAQLAAIVASSDDAIVSKTLDGRITSWNGAATRIFGYTAEEMIGQPITRIIPPDLLDEEREIIARLKRGQGIDHFDTVRVTKDGRRLNVSLTISPLRDGAGNIVGASKVARDITARKRAEESQTLLVQELQERQIESALLAAIVANSDDAIISKTLDGLVTSWNGAATRIFGYQAEEMIGRPITRIIPPELLDEEREIIARLRRGERIEHFDTIRVAKDGRKMNVSLTISPLRDSGGNIVGASKVARDITERKRAEELQALLFEELNHRVKNTLATIQALASQSLRRAATPRDFVSSFNGRIQALSRAHDLLVESQMRGAQLSDILREQVLLGSAGDQRISCSGPSLMLDARLATQLALVLHELATNARKYGALSVPDGRLSIGWIVQEDAGRELVLEWKEDGVPRVSAPKAHGFGTTLIERTLRANGGSASVRYERGGIACILVLPLPEQDQREFPFASSAFDDRRAAATLAHRRLDLRGKRVLVVEDEALVALEIETELTAAGCEVVGPASTLQSAKRLAVEASFDCALVDANLAGQSVKDLLAVLRQKSVPFALATGYGAKALPPGLGENPVLVKPFSSDQLLSMVQTLLTPSASEPARVIPLKSGRS